MKQSTRFSLRDPSSRSSALSFLVRSLGGLQTVQFLGLLDLLEDCATVDAPCARTSNTAKNTNNNNNDNDKYIIKLISIIISQGLTIVIYVIK